MNKRTNKVLFLVLICVLSISCTIVSHKRFVEIDYRNNNVPVKVTGIPLTKVITIDMAATENYDFSAADMYRCYLQAAEELKDKKYDRVYLSNKGEKVFFITGEYFSELGYLYSLGMAPDFEMPEHVYNLDGTPAYGSWSGGWLDVLNKQLEDFNDMMGKLVP